MIGNGSRMRGTDRMNNKRHRVQIHFRIRLTMVRCSRTVKNSQLFQLILKLVAKRPEKETNKNRYKYCFAGVSINILFVYNPMRCFGVEMMKIRIDLLEKDITWTSFYNRQ